jgi:hypothetical protein
MSFIEIRWNRLPERRRLCLLALATWACALLATICLLRNDGVREVLYKAF